MINVDKVLNGAIQLLACALVAGGTAYAVVEVRSEEPPAIVTARMTDLVRDFASATAEQDLSPSEMQQRVAAFTVALEAAVQEVGANNHIIIMPAEAVVAGASEDITELIQAMIAHRLGGGEEHANAFRP